MRIRIGFGGWIGVDDLGLPGLLYVRVRETERRLEVSEIYLDGQGTATITPRDLREIPLGEIEGFINRYADVVKSGMDRPSPDLSTLASYFRTEFHSGLLADKGHWVEVQFIAQEIIPEGEDWAVLLENGDVLTGEEAKARLAEGLPFMRVPRQLATWVDVRETDRDFRLTAGPVDGLTDEFLRDVARAYSAAVARGERPNVSISEQTGYRVRSVQRWVYTARQRGIMPRGQRGRAG